MFIRQPAYKMMRCTLCSTFLIVLLLVIISSDIFAQAITVDSNSVLNKVIVTSNKKQNVYTKAVPVQLLNNETLQQINGYSIGDAASYFSGVLIKDYGGIGGLKTISVRSLGASNTGVLYDGIPVADAQSGQIDLSKFSSTFVQSLELDLANPQQMLLPARAYSSAAVLSITSNTYTAINFTQKKWLLGAKQGSFGLWQPFAGMYFPVTKSFVISANAEATWANGNYPYTIENGVLTQKVTRSNSDVTAFQGELNAVKQFADSSTLQTKIWGYASERGLPGVVIFFNNNISVQRLQDNDLFVQSRYQAKINMTTSLLIAAKYSYVYTRYRDPNFFNGTGGLDDKYTQQEGYASIALSKRFGKYITTSIASDIAVTGLTANINNFPTPIRTNLWNSIAIQFTQSLWQINASLLNTNNSDQTKVGPSLENKNEFTPTIAGSYKVNTNSPFLFRAFYKKIFRMPTFNDVYYNYISSIDPKLRPEYADQYNIGITYTKNFNLKIKQVNISVDAYYNNVKDKIVAVPSQNLFMWTVMNVGKVDIKGIDVTADVTGLLTAKISWSARIAYSLQQALDVTDPSNGEYKNQIPYTPVNSGSGLMAFMYKTWTAGYTMLFSGYRYSLGENDPTNELPGWITQDVFVSRSIHIHQVQANIKAEVKNIFDTRYAIVQYYPMEGRSYKISILFNNL
ncbi:MAG TPA: TonB-dependent receptor [Ferruginibacter sp.]|jgi:vitamin B12 transporter|nr:TonB-dependent receptor [Ferruginibacter sp.]